MALAAWAHIMGAPGIMEEGRICACAFRGVHLFTTPGPYGCYAIDLSPMPYDSPVHIGDNNDLAY